MKIIKRISIFICILFLGLSLASCQIISTQGGDSAFDIAVKHGFVGTEEEWLASLKGDKGDSLTITNMYEAAVLEGFEGSLTDFISTYFKDTDITGLSAYEVAKQNGYKGTEEEWLASLKGETGMAGADGKTGEVNLFVVYQKLVELGDVTCSYYEFVNQYLDVSITVDNSANISQSLLKCAIVVAASEPVEKWSESEKLSGQVGASIIYKINKEAGEAYFITNYHVVYDEDNKKVINDLYMFFYGKMYKDYAVPATFVGGSATYDIAVLKVTDSDEIKNGNYQAVEWADSNDTIVGEEIYCIGNPKGSGLAATQGIVSVDSESIDMSPISTENVTVTNGVVSMRVTRIDAPINSGNSGGGCFLKNGKLLGIVNAKNTQNDDIGYMIPGNIARFVADNIIDNCDGDNNIHPVKCLMGIAITSDNVRTYYDEATKTVKIVEDVKVKQVIEGGISQGVIFEDDIIKSMTLRGVTYDATRTFVLIDAVLNAREGDIATLEVLRNGVLVTVTVTFAKGNIVG